MFGSALASTSTDILTSTSLSTGNECKIAQNASISNVEITLNCPPGVTVDEVVISNSVSSSSKCLTSASLESLNQAAIDNDAEAQAGLFTSSTVRVSNSVVTSTRMKVNQACATKQTASIDNVKINGCAKSIKVLNELNAVQTCELDARLTASQAMDIKNVAVAKGYDPSLFFTTMLVVGGVVLVVLVAVPLLMSKTITSSLPKMPGI
mmetsp:Transcript_47585/g.123259  ORF Transcript_47585/g.123259 Transcript_47585/m.123259 type:complete len:208 (-) Transcript_47585:2795-3418(-)